MAVRRYRYLKSVIAPSIKPRRYPLPSPILFLRQSIDIIVKNKQGLPRHNANYVTSIEPRFYSNELKKHTECLVYIPYYATSGGMMEGQSLCPAYYHADYIIIQAEKYRRFFDPSVPGEKLVPLGYTCSSIPNIGIRIRNASLNIRCIIIYSDIFL